MRAHSAACGTCRSLALSGQPIEHEECAARAVLLLAPDQPAYEDLVDLTDEQRQALPARFHTPVFEDCGRPNAWQCRVCWGDGWVAQWPCGPAQRQGALVFASEVAAEDIAAELERLPARIAELEPGTGTRQFLAFALDLAAEKITTRPAEFNEADEDALAALRRWANERPAPDTPMGA
ncbi:hypothetical protein [Streptomyces sp. CAU 1734]|uniref:hypothetical protein n=1 Tax=Streptomyces sp. CAU 1734 TaxID=3140360 RepID=UPI003261A437